MRRDCQANTDFYLAYGDGKEAEDEQGPTHFGKMKCSSTVLTATHPEQRLWFPLSSTTCTASTDSTQMLSERDEE